MNLGTAMILVDGDKVLLQHRDDKPGINYPGYWTLPGGRANPGETPLDAINRELREETGYEANPKFFKWVMSRQGTDDFRIHVFWDSYDHIQKVVCHEGQGFEFKSLMEMAGLKVVPLTLQLVREFRNWKEVVQG